MTTNELVQEPHERLVEVLLEEEFRRARMVSPRRQNSRWLAAAVVLLGLSVVGGVMVLRGGGDAGVVPVQDPQPAPKEPETVVLKTHAEFLALADQVRRVRLQVAQSWQGGFVGLRDAVATIDEPQLVRSFVAGIQEGTGGLDPELVAAVVRNQPASIGVKRLAPDAQVTFELGDGRVIHGAADSQIPTFGLTGLHETQPAGPFRSQLQALHAQALTNHRIAHGDTKSFEELARVPATATAIRCPQPPPGTVERHLGRFAQLERLHLELAWNLSNGALTVHGTTPIRLDEFSALRHLRHFQFPGNGLVDADAAALARMKNLTSVRIDGGLGDLSEVGARTLVRNLEALELVGVRNAEVVLGAAITTPRLRKLTLARIDLPAELFAQLLAALVAMPTLVELDLGAGCWTDLHMAMLLKAKAPLACLRLQCTEVSTLGFGSLVALPSLRELDLRRTRLQPDALAELEKALPNCRIRRPGEQPEPTFPYIPAATRR